MVVGQPMVVLSATIQTFDGTFTTGGWTTIFSHKHHKLLLFLSSPRWERYGCTGRRCQWGKTFCRIWRVPPTKMTVARKSKKIAKSIRSWQNDRNVKFDIWQKSGSHSKKMVFRILFWPQTDSTQWAHNLTMSWDNFGYLGFSSRCPLNGLYLAARRAVSQHRLPKTTLFGAQKC